MNEEKKGCFDCVIYRQKCNGRKLYNPSEKPHKKCLDRVQSFGGKFNPVQVNAFIFLHNNLRKQQGPCLSPEYCLAKAIVLTSDDAFAKLSDDLIQTIKKNLKMKGK